MRSEIRFPCKLDTGTFARYTPFIDPREVIVRRGKERDGPEGHRYGLEQGRKTVEVSGVPVPLVRYQAILSPPPLRPGQKPMSREAAARYHPVGEVLYLPDAEVYLKRDPGGFSDAEVERILQGIVLHAH